MSAELRRLRICGLVAMLSPRCGGEVRRADGVGGDDGGAPASLEMPAVASAPVCVDADRGWSAPHRHAPTPAPADALRTTVSATS